MKLTIKYINQLIREMVDAAPSIDVGYPTDEDLTRMREYAYKPPSPHNMAAKAWLYTLHQRATHGTKRSPGSQWVTILDYFEGSTVLRDTVETYHAQANDAVRYAGITVASVTLPVRVFHMSGLSSFNSELGLLKWRDANAQEKKSIMADWLIPILHREFKTTLAKLKFEWGLEDPKHLPKYYPGLWAKFHGTILKILWADFSERYGAELLTTDNTGIYAHALNAAMQVLREL